jgi:L-lactate dehydrogenase complex protein LldG
VPPMNDSRQAILDRIRMAQEARSTSHAVKTNAARNATDHSYHRIGSLGLSDRIALFKDRLEECGAGVRRCSGDDVAATLREILSAGNRRDMVIPDGIPPNWLPDGISFTVGDRFSAPEIDRFEGVLTGCTVAIALTGSIVLQNASAQGPRVLSLVPDYHLCVVLTEQIVETVPEGFDRITATATLPTTFISGPSATADIEMTRIKGVHGPRFLDVLIVGQLFEN